MSFQTTVVVVVPMMPDALDALEPRLLGEPADGQDGTLLTRLAFDPTGFTAHLHVYGATYSRFADSEFLDWLSGLPWEWPGGWPYRDQVRIIAHHSLSDIAPLVYRLTDSSWERIDPP